MKEKVIIKRNEDVIFKGNVLNMPIKEESIIHLSIELFGDDDPCIIHQSFVIKELVNDMLELFKKNNTKKIFIKDFSKELDFIKVKDLETISIELMG